MFHNLAEDIAFLLIKNKVLDIEQRDVYVYGIEVILLNSIIIPVFLILSLLFNTMINFWAYLIFFLPLRTFSGGYHADTSERCLILSAIMYVLSIAVTRAFPLLYQNLYWKIAGIISLLVIVIMAPLISENNPLTTTQRTRNRIVVYILLVFDLAFFILSCNYKLEIASNELVFIVFAASLLLLGKFKQYILKCEEHEMY